ncbi:MAG: DUF2163 domain-containing protein [Zhengella sp.]|uniref:DUF2163 domain-containing protein n=1 Tax=Zhengella sp. TaxID=2282762 RepID=UPI001DD4BDA2|nr:DUF2163 domain-containing protein [Notoacmeibacter sp.]MCC0026362.1 DUF2163 domain-containing protein [Brucellaceae bacterium]
MTRFPQALSDHAAGEATTLCQCWRVRRADGTVLGFTDHDEALVFDGIAHRPRTGFSASEARQSLGLAADASEIEGALSDDEIREEDIEAGLYDNAAVETWLVNWSEPAQRALLRSTVIGRVTRRDGRFLAELQSLSASLDKPRSRVLRRACSAELGDRACGIDLAAEGMTATVTVWQVVPPVSLSIQPTAGPVGWLVNGWLETNPQPPAAQRRYRIRAHLAEGAGERLVLADQPQPALEAGDSVRLVAGCDKQFATCRDRFGNALNFRGFPHLPGNDAAFGYVTEDLPLDGKPVVP